MGLRAKHRTLYACISDCVFVVVQADHGHVVLSRVYNVYADECVLMLVLDEYSLYCV